MRPSSGPHRASPRPGRARRARAPSGSPRHCAVERPDNQARQREQRHGDACRRPTVGAMTSAACGSVSRQCSRNGEADRRHQQREGQARSTWAWRSAQRPLKKGNSLIVPGMMRVLSQKSKRSIARRRPKPSRSAPAICPKASRLPKSADCRRRADAAHDRPSAHCVGARRRTDAPERRADREGRAPDERHRDRHGDIEGDLRRDAVSFIAKAWR